MNWSQFKDPVSHMCFAGVVVAFWSLTQDVAGSNPFKIVINIYRPQYMGRAWLGACIAGGDVWQRGCVARGMRGKRDGHCSGRYASYWNAFLFVTELNKIFRENSNMSVNTCSSRVCYFHENHKQLTIDN